jgi:hypothetical protein
MPLQTINALNLITCTGCPAPQPLTVTSNQTSYNTKQFSATVNDCVPMVNIKPFGPCAFTPLPPSPSGGPCIPKPVGTWMPGSFTLFHQKQRALRMSDKLQCGSGGTISFINPGQFTQDDD